MGRVEEVVETLSVRAGESLVGRICLDFTLYLPPSIRAAEVRAGILRVFSRVSERYAAQWGWYETEESEAPRRLQANVLEWPARWFAPEARTREEYRLLVRDGAKADDIGTTAFEMGAIGHGDFPAYLRLSLPVTALEQGAPAYARQCEELAALTPFVSGRAGYSLRWDEYQRRHPRAGLQNAELLAEWYHGVDVPDDSAAILSPWLLEKIPAINWLTFLGPALVAKAGGREALEGRISAPVELRNCGQGLVLQAGLQPETGNSPEPADLDPYGSVSRALASLLGPAPSVLRHADAWARRFGPAAEPAF